MVEFVGDEAKKKNEVKSLSFFKLLSYADLVDWILMGLGSIGSIVHGMALPVGYLLLGKALNAFGNNIHDIDAMVRALKKVGILHAYSQKRVSVRKYCCLSWRNWYGCSCCVQIVPFVWYMAIATFPAGVLGNFFLSCHWYCLWNF